MNSNTVEIMSSRPSTIVNGSLELHLILRAESAWLRHRCASTIYFRPLCGLGLTADFDVSEPCFVHGQMRAWPEGSTDIDWAPIASTS